MKRSIGRRATVLALALLVGLASETRADSIKSMTFNVPSNTSFWGPGRSASSIDKRGTAAISVLGKDVGVGYRVKASSGKVSGSYRGSMELTGADTFDLAGGGLFSLRSKFAPTSYSMSTAFGASIDLFGFVESVGQLSFPGFPKGNTLDSKSTKNLDLGDNRNFKGSANFDAAGLDLWVVELGATLKITQSTNFKPTSIGGKLIASHVGTGTRIQRSYTIGDAIDFDLGLDGEWRFSLEDLRLRNSFSTSMGGGIGGYVDSVVGRAELTTKPITFLSAKSFELAFGERDWLNAMSVTVFDSSATNPTPGADPVPEPGTWVLMGAVGVFVAVRRMRRQS